MTTNNGKSTRKNSNGKSANTTVSSLPEDRENLPTVDELLTTTSEKITAQTAENETPPLLEALDSTPQSQEQLTASAEDLLRNAKSQTQQPEETQSPTEQQPQQAQESGELATASSQINNALLQAGQNLVEASTEADQELFAAGLEDAIASGDIMTQGYQAGLLIRYGKGKLTSAQSLREQMNVLRSHTDASNNTAITGALEQLGLDVNPTEADEKKSPKSTPFGQISQAMSNSRKKEGINLFQNQKQQ
ncbi:hypothetical protein HW132_12805 [Brasilonema sp. CT11]|nr:hypothetical protein [Brasilonema sp. CT11]